MVLDWHTFVQIFLALRPSIYIPKRLLVLAYIPTLLHILFLFFFLSSDLFRAGYLDIIQPAFTYTKYLPGSYASIKRR